MQETFRGRLVAKELMLGHREGRMKWRHSLEYEKDEQKKRR